MPDESFVNMVERNLSDHEYIRSRLTKEGPALIREMIGNTRGVRWLASRSGFSPTYLCRVRSGKNQISREAYLKLVTIWEDDHA